MVLQRSSAWLRRRGRCHTCSVQRPCQAETSSKRRHVPKVQPWHLSKDLLPLLMAASVPAFLGRHRRPGLGRSPQQQFLNEWEEAAGTRATAAPGEAQEEAGQQEVDRDLPEQQQLEESASVHTIWVRPSCQRLVPWRHLRDSEATDADGEADGNPQSAPLPQAVAAGAEAEDPPLAGGSQQEGTSMLLHTSGSSEGGPAASPSHGGCPHQGMALTCGILLSPCMFPLSTKTRQIPPPPETPQRVTQPPPPSHTHWLPGPRSSRRHFGLCAEPSPAAVSRGSESDGAGRRVLAAPLTLRLVLWTQSTRRENNVDARHHTGGIRLAPQHMLLPARRKEEDLPAKSCS
ncbi:uncharacterized protein LOC134145380 isoform X1 [Rhea pennata]|uniref:uncharacterized protein LOC134145380 isoform X1 n=1 Tax=Rhea pennata TaxID=8795 RepID=UPI002E25ADA9